MKKNFKKVLTMALSYSILASPITSFIALPKANAATFTSTTSMVSVKDYGATGNDTSDDTASIQKAIDAAVSAGKTLDFPAGSYYINPDIGLSLRNNSSLYFENGAELISKASSNGTYFIVKIWGVNNVKMTGYPTVIGERNIHKGSGGESGMGIGIANSNSVYIENPKISNCWGDGIYIGDNGLSNHTNKDVTIENAILDNNRRQGISVISAINLKIDNPKITNTNGTPPAAGIDFEPNYGYQYLQNITVTNPFITGNDGHGLQFSIGLGPTDSPVSINIINASNVKNNEKHNYYGSALSEYNLWVTGKEKGQIMIDGKNYWLVGSPTITNPTPTPTPTPSPTPSQPTPTPSQPSNSTYSNDFSTNNMSSISQGYGEEWKINNGKLIVNDPRSGGSAISIVGTEKYAVGKITSVDMNLINVAAGISFAQTNNGNFYNATLNNAGTLKINYFGENSAFGKTYPINLNGNKQVNMTVKTDSKNNIMVTVKDMNGKVLGTVNDNLNTIAGRTLDLTGAQSGLYIESNGTVSFDNLTIASSNSLIAMQTPITNNGNSTDTQKQIDDMKSSIKQLNDKFDALQKIVDNLVSSFNVLKQKISQLFS